MADSLFGIMWLGDDNSPAQLCEVMDNVYHACAFTDIAAAKREAARLSEYTRANGSPARYAAAPIPPHIRALWID